MKTRVAFVLKLLDDYSGKVIRKEAFLFYADGELLHPIVKDEGMYGIPVVSGIKSIPIRLSYVPDARSRPDLFLRV